MKIIIAIVIAFAVSTPIVLWLQSESPGPDPEPQHEKIWCYLRTIQSGESFGEVAPGTYDYAVIYTRSGIDLYQRCSTIEE